MLQHVHCRGATIRAPGRVANTVLRKLSCVVLAPGQSCLMMLSAIKSAFRNGTSRRPMNPPTFSVIIPTYNRAQTLTRAIKSVIDQTLQNWELLVVDDASTDDTPQLVKRFRDRRIRYLRRQANGGVSAARNDGIKAARGEYVALLDSDDRFLPTFLERTLHALRASVDNETGLSWTGTISHHTTSSSSDFLVIELIRKRLWAPTYASREEAFRASLEWDPVWGTGHGVTIKRTVLEHVGLFDERLRAREDIDIFLRLMRATDYVVIPEYLVEIYHDHDLSVDSQHLEQARSYELIYRKHRKDIIASRRAYGFFHGHIARQYYLGGSQGRAIYHSLAILRRQPGNSSAYAQTLRSLIALVANIRRTVQSAALEHSAISTKPD